MTTNANLPPRPGLYRHYKGNLYQVIGTCRYSETGEELVLYRALYGRHDLWVRPVEMFAQTVIVDGVGRLRFECVLPDSSLIS